MSTEPGKHPGQTHLNSDAKIADEGRPQGAPLPIVQLSSLGVMPWGGHPQGAPLPIVFSRRYALGRAPTRGAPTLSSLGVMPWGGHPQGAPLPIVFSPRYALGRAGAPLPFSRRYPGEGRGAPTYCLLSALCPGEGTHKGRPYLLSSLRRYALGRAPTRGAPTYCLLSALCPGEGTHKGRPYLLSSLRRYALGRAPTRGAPTYCLLSALCPGEGAHKGRPYLLSSLRVMPWGGHPQGAPLPDSGNLRWFCPNLMQLPWVNTRG